MVHQSLTPVEFLKDALVCINGVTTRACTCNILLNDQGAQITCIHRFYVYQEHWSGEQLEGKRESTNQRDGLILQARSFLL